MLFLEISFSFSWSGREGPNQEGILDVEQWSDGDQPETLQSRGGSGWIELEVVVHCAVATLTGMFYCGVDGEKRRTK